MEPILIFNQDDNFLTTITDFTELSYCISQSKCCTTGKYFYLIELRRNVMSTVAPMDYFGRVYRAGVYRTKADAESELHRLFKQSETEHKSTKPYDTFTFKKPEPDISALELCNLATAFIA